MPEDVTELSREEYILYGIKYCGFHMDEGPNKRDKTEGNILLHKCGDKTPMRGYNISDVDRYFANYIFNKMIELESGIYDARELEFLVEYYIDKDKEPIINSSEFHQNTCDNCLQVIIDNRIFFDKHNFFETYMGMYIQQCFGKPEFKYLFDDLLSGKQKVFPYPFEGYPKHEIKVLDQRPSIEAGCIYFDIYSDYEWGGCGYQYFKIEDFHSMLLSRDNTSLNEENVIFMNNFIDENLLYCKIIDYHLQEGHRAADFGAR